MIVDNDFFDLPKTLTGFVKNKEVQTSVLELIKLPPNVIKNKPVKAAPQTKRYVITGTAFELYIQCRLYREFKKKCLNKFNFKIFKQIAKPNKIWKEAWKKAHKEIEKYIEKESDANDEFLKALIVQPDFPADMLGKIMSAYYGGRSEVHSRREIAQILYCDFLSMYPTVCTLMGLWRFVTAQGMTWRDTTAETREFLEKVWMLGWIGLFAIPTAWQ